MSVIVDGTNGLTFPNSSTQTVAGAPLATPSFTSTIGVGNTTASASGAGVSFPATQSASSDANTLDDYEEGTWTPTFVSGAGSFGSISYQNRSGYYTKIGNLVFVGGQFYTSSLAAGTASGQVSIGGLPFMGNAGIEWAAYLRGDIRGFTTQQPKIAGVNYDRIQLYYFSSLTADTTGLGVANLTTSGNSNIIGFAAVYQL